MTTPIKKSVQMKFSETTVQKVEALRELTRTDNRTQIVAQAISLYHAIESAKKEKNGNVYIEYPDNSRDKLILL